MSELGSWWDDLSAAALVGTARRPVPDLPERLGTARDGAGREVALLDAAALGSALRRAGVRTTPAEPVAGAADDVRPAPPARAVQLLELLLHQSPVGAALAPDLVRVWVDAADATGVRAPHHLLPELLDLATARAELRPGVRRTADARGRWLAEANPTWRWAVGEAPVEAAEVDPAQWAREPTARRVAAVVGLRASDPAAARALVESTWDTDAAGDRVALLSALRTGLGPEDEALLERALDDRSAKVREAAVPLLDGLPTSARAARMADRLRPLLQVRGLLRKTLEIALPDEPDPAGVRDGLGRPRRAGSVRGWRLQRIVAGAPLDVWTDVTRSQPADAWRLIGSQDAQVGVIEAVLARRDRAWAAAVVRDVWHPGVLGLLPAELLDEAATGQLARATPHQVATVVAAVPAPWGPSFSRAVLQRLAAEADPTVLVGQLAVRLATGLDPVTRPAFDRWAASLEPTARERVARVSQYLALVPEIPEAFR